MKMKKIAVFLLAVCLMGSNVTMLTFAADGKVMFTDPSTAVGETLELKGVVTSSTDIEDRKVEMTYDTSMLRFKNGENVTETEEGKLVYEVTGKRDGNRVEFMMYFDVLKEGTTEVKAVAYQAWDSNDSQIECQMGYSSIKIAEGEAPVDTPDTPDVSEGVSVEVNGTTYTLVNEFAEDIIPAGYEKSTINYGGGQYTVVTHPNTGVTLGYLVDASGEGAFFYYNVDNATFLPYEELKISDLASIVLLSDVEGIVLPETYIATTVTVNGNEFPAWQNSENATLCILYAMGSNGVRSLYQYDSTEGTYQRFEAPEVEQEQVDDSFIGKLSDLLENHMDYVILGTGLGFILFVLIIVVLSVKLYNRNAELDELYEELGIDLDDEDEEASEETEEDDDSVIKFIDDEDEDFVRIDEEVEEDVVFAEDETDEVEVEFYQEPVEEKAVEIKKEQPVVEQTPVQEESDFYDDDDDDDFEFDFIDLDD